jgi:hypothetical protein
MIRALPLLILLIGCNSDGLSTEGRGGDLGAPDLSATKGACAADTPGMVMCFNQLCPVGQCWSCYAGIVCSATPPDAFCFAQYCDGPEDCPNRQTCSVFESTTCGDPVEQMIYCHCDDECPKATPHCDGTFCHA